MNLVNANKEVTNELESQAKKAGAFDSQRLQDENQIHEVQDELARTKLELEKTKN